jgi:hypothetical protein
MRSSLQPHRTLPLLLAVAWTLGCARWAYAQTVLIDAGSFRLSVGGREVGRDSFNIRRTGAGTETRILAQGWIDVDQRRISSLLETTGGFGLTRYQANVTGAESSEFHATVNGRRLLLGARSSAGEQAREARAREGAVLLEENVAHHYFFLGALAREGGRLPVIVPRVDEQADFVVGSITPERVTVGGQEIAARRVQVMAEGRERLVWVDAEGRVLRVEIPSTGFLAERLRALPVSVYGPTEF